jgi:LacI family transcriptional regulator, galactose operon repressor
VVTIADVARQAGVSIATVSRVLSPAPDPHPVKPATAERVRAAARDLRFEPSAIARGLVARRTGMLGLVVPDLTDPHYPQIASGVEQAARSADLSVLICNTLGDTALLTDYVRLLRARRVDGMLLSGGSSLTERDLRLAAASGVPLVLIGRPAFDARLPYVSIDNVAAAHAATQHLIDLGRTCIAHLAGPSSQTTMLDRARGYRTALRQRGLMSPVVIDTDGTPEHAYDVLRERLQGEPPDAIFAATDRLAVAALAALHDARVRVPRDVAVIGFDDIPLAALLRPALASVAQPAVELGRAAVHMVVSVAEGRVVEPVVLTAVPVIRASARP